MIPLTKKRSRRSLLPNKKGKAIVDLSSSQCPKATKRVHMVQKAPGKLGSTPYCI